MKRINILHPAILALGILALSACQAEDETSPIGGEEAVLAIAPTVAGMNEESVTRTATNSFFNQGDEITVKITTNRTAATAESYTYKYGTDAIFSSASPFRFKLDNTYIKNLEALWPKEDIRSQGIVLDQRELEAYQQADRLQALSSSANIMPTAEPVPLIFQHEQSRFTFRMAGQNANGLNILSVILELQYDDGSGQNKPGAFWAYCDNTETASLILVPGTKIAANGAGYQVVDGRYMIGQAEVGNATTKYTGGIWLKEAISVTLEKGTDYLVTLTPEGYNLMANIEIHGFGQDEGYVGIPIQMPTAVAGESGKYQIANAIQLVTLSRILQGEIKGQDADTWKSYTYTLQNSLAMTENAKLYYRPLDDSMKGKIVDENGNEIESINGFPLFSKQ